MQGRAQLFLSDLVPSVGLPVWVLPFALLCEREEVKSVLAVSSVCHANCKRATHLLDPLPPLLPASCPGLCPAAAATGACPGPWLSSEKHCSCLRANQICEQTER